MASPDWGLFNRFKSGQGTGRFFDCRPARFRAATNRALPRCVLHRRQEAACEYHHEEPSQCPSALAFRLGGEKDRRRQPAGEGVRLRARDRSAALITVAAAVIERYREEKERRGLLDYEDLIDKTLELLRDASTKSTAA